MRSNFVFAIVILLTLSCTNQSDKSAIQRFEKQLGLEKARALSHVVETFENEIKEKYKTSSIEQAYQRHLEQVKSRFIPMSEWLSAQNRRDSIFSLCKCGLVDEIWIRPETVYMEGTEMHKVYFHPGTQDTFLHSTRLLRQSEIERNLDSVLSYWKRVDTFYEHGDLLRAFKSVSKENETLNWYYETKFHAGTFSEGITADNLLENEVDFKDYFIKRIVVIETYK